MSYFALTPASERVRKSARGNLPESPCTLGLRRPTRARMKKLFKRYVPVCVCVCVCVSTFSEPTKLSDEKITEKSKFLCVVGAMECVAKCFTAAKVY